MAELSVAHRAALAQVIGGVPDRTLSQLALMVAGMPGERARGLETVLAEETRDRRRRDRAFAPLAPLFQPRADGVAANLFPAPVMWRLWKAASAREPGLLSALDEDSDRGEAAADAVSDRICVAAAGIVRDHPDLIWPPAGDEAAREVGLVELAGCCDLAPLVRRGLPSLPAWVARPSADQLAELRLLVRDAAAVAPEGARRLLDILFAQLGDAALILRLVAHSSSAAAREAFLFESELAVFVDRLITAVEGRVGRIKTYRPIAGRDPIRALRDDIQWCADVLSELDITIELRPGSAWGKQVRDARVRINQKLLSLLNAVEAAVDRALPMERVQTFGRISRMAPKLDRPPDPDALESARAGLTLLRAVRNSAGVFGCEARRWQLMQAMIERLTTYADETLEAINAGEAADESAALALVDTTARLLDLIEAADQARLVRRRAAVAGAVDELERTSPATA